MADLRRVWWLASYPKSGNTWLRAFLSAYQTGSVDINAITHVVGDLNDYFHQVVSPTPISKLSLGEFLCIHPAAVLHLALLQRSDPVLVKTHNANTLVDRVPLLPLQITAGAIYLVRDPRDICISWAEHLGCSIDEAIDRMADDKFCITTDANLTHILSSWSKHVNSYTGEQDFRVGLVRYEDLLTDPIAKFGGILRYMGIPVDADRLADAVVAAGFGSLQAQEQAHGFGEKKHQNGLFFARGTAGHWREILTEEQIARIEARHYEAMQKHGYEIITDPAARADQAAA